LVALAVRSDPGEAVDPLAVTVVREAFGGVSAHLDSLFAMQGIGSYALAVAGSARVQKEWLPRVAALDAIAALGLTEPEVGSDLRSITTTVRVDGDELVLDGRKSFITNAPAAAVARVGEPGQPCPLVRQTLATFRVSVAGSAVGLAQAVLDEAVAHTTPRGEFGTTLARLGPLPQMRGTCGTEIEQARLLTYAAA